MAHAESSQPARKRPRPAFEAEEQDEKPFVNHPTLYFDDGNVILRAGRMLFCVHRSLLAKHSVVFRELFERGHEQFRGMLHFTMEETAEEVEALLNVIYDGLRVDVQDLTIETFPTLGNVLRMATKYKISRPCADIISRIRAEWPSTLTQHDAKESEFRARLLKIYGAAGKPRGDQNNAQGEPAQPRDGPAAAESQEDIIVHPASVIGLLRQCGYNDSDLLFPLFYALSRTTWQFGGPAIGHHLAPLSSADTERLVIGIERLHTAHVSFATNVPECVPAPTNPPHFCRQGATELWTTILHTLLPARGRRAREPLEEWHAVVPLVNAQYAQHQICHLCAQSIVSRIELFRQNLWASLPASFELS